MNLVISNVPGPGVPLYLAGARMLSNAPASIVVHGIACSTSRQTYEKHLEVGVIACGEALPDIDALVAQLWRRPSSSSSWRRNPEPELTPG
ncbi:MAG: WS/DGAT domain-containing protein [Inhella sp.]